MFRETVKIKKLSNNAIIPTKGSEFSAGFDLCANIDQPITIEPHKTVKIGTGLSFELPNGTFGAIFARSGLATKKGIRPSNCVGVCDSDYRGEYIVPLYNDSDDDVIIEPNQKIAQLILLPYIEMDFVEIDKLTDTKRGNGGFGSTDKK